MGLFFDFDDARIKKDVGLQSPGRQERGTLSPVCLDAGRGENLGLRLGFSWVWFCQMLPLVSEREGEVS